MSYDFPVASSRTFIRNPAAYPPKDLAESSVSAISSFRTTVSGLRAYMLISPMPMSA